MSVFLKNLSVTSVLFVSFWVFPAFAETKILMETSQGNIVLSLDEEKAPITVANFVAYTNEGFYDGTVFHRVIPNFMIQGGGFDQTMKQKATKKEIINEGNNGLLNNRGTIAMARRPDPNSATAQFFINHKDNHFLNASSSDAGYAVFGKVIEGMDVLDKIAQVATTTKNGHQNVPVQSVIIQTMRVLENKPEQTK